MSHISSELETLAEQFDGRAGFGALETSRGCLPLTAMDVRGKITGITAHLRIRQTFRNTLAEPIEATYIFPLPDRAAVTRFRMKVADRVIEGDLKERAEARAEYDAAIRTGHQAAIAEEDRSGTFNMRVGNLPPGEEAEVELELVGPLDVRAGEATFRFPLVVAPRYTSGIPLEGNQVGAGTAVDTDQVPDASRVTPPVLLKGFPNPVRLSLELKLDCDGLPIGEEWSRGMESSLHTVVVEEHERSCTVRLQPGERLNRDFILRFPVSGATVGTMLKCVTAEGDGPGVFALTLMPPTYNELTKPQPRDVVFVLDRSGSMHGWKMVAARRAVARMVDSLLEHDRFAIFAFDNTIEMPDRITSQFIDASDRNRWRAMEWLGGIESRGGTEMSRPLIQAANYLAESPQDRRRIVVLVTDGQISGEDAVLRQFTDAAKGALPTVFTVGIDRAVNAGFLNRLADLSGGQAELVESEDRLDEVMTHMHANIGTPQLTNVRIEPIGADIVEGSISPSRLPDLYPDRPVTICGRFTGSESMRMRIHALDSNGENWQQEITATPDERRTLLCQWGRRRVRELEDRYAAGGGWNNQALQSEIVSVSLESHVLSRFTAYVAVDRSAVVNEGGEVQQITQPVEFPAGWEEDTAFDMQVESCLSLEPSHLSLIPEADALSAAPDMPLFATAPDVSESRASKRGSAKRPPSFDKPRAKKLSAAPPQQPPRSSVAGTSPAETKSPRGGDAKTRPHGKLCDAVIGAIQALQGRSLFKSRRRRLMQLLRAIEALLAHFDTSTNRLSPEQLAERNRWLKPLRDAVEWIEEDLANAQPSDRKEFDEELVQLLSAVERLKSRKTTSRPDAFWV